MNEDRIEMSQCERDRLKVMAPVLEGRRTQTEAARLLKRCVRQVRRIQRRLEREGDRGILHRLRGRPSNRSTAAAFRQEVMTRYRQRYVGIGPTMAAEKLAQEGLIVSDETLRHWLLDAQLWQRKRQRDKHRQRRERRECFGELVQSDGSHHDWLQGRGERMVLLVMIDDATSKTMARFYRAETTEAYMDLLRRYLRKRGRMVAMYVDRDSIFRAEKQDPYNPQPTLTQFKRALMELEIDLILANSPQAKGRVERFNQTAQNRLVHELRLESACTLDQANEVLERVFLPWFERTCTVQPRSANNAHRRLHPSMNLQGILSIQEKRKVTNDYTIRLDNRLYQILPPALPGLRGGWVTVEKRLDGSLHLRLKKQYLKYKLCGSGKVSGALPPNPRSLPHLRTTAERAKEEGSAAGAAEPSAVRSAAGRSGRTPAEPCLPSGASIAPKSATPSPRPRSKWMDNFRLRGSRPPKPDILTLAK